MTFTFKQLVVFLPLITAVTTFILTSLFTLYREGKTNNNSKRAVLEYQEYDLKYPFENPKKYGEGLLLLNDNGLHVTEKYAGGTVSFLILRNVTSNDVINVKITSVVKSREGKVLTQTFTMPIWKSSETLYIPQNMHESDSYYVTNESLKIEYSTLAFEKFRFGYKKTKDKMKKGKKKKGQYKDYFQKKYLGFIYIRLLKYHKGDFYRFVKIVDNKTKEKKEEESNTAG